MKKNPLQIVAVLFLLLSIVSCKKENQPPTCFIVSPWSGDVISRGGDITINVEANDADGKVVSIDLYIDNKLVSSQNGEALTYQWKTGDVEGEQHLLRAVATDNESATGEDAFDLNFIIFRPKVTTLAIADITDTSAVLTGELTDDGGSLNVEYGFCWTDKSNPTVDDFVVFTQGEKGEYEQTISPLDMNTRYSVKAFARNEKSIVYGEVIYFTSRKYKTGQFTDARDGHVYKTTKIGDQWWMAENLAYLPSITYTNDYFGDEPRYYVYDYNGISVDAAKATENYSKYGVLYNMPAGEVACPDGWHIPSAEEWNQMFNYIKQQESVSDEELGNLLRTTNGWGGYYEDKNGIDSYGFSALPGGMVESSGYFQFKDNMGFWRMEPWPGISDMGGSINIGTNIFKQSTYKSYVGLSIRCVKD